MTGDVPLTFGFGASGVPGMTNDAHPLESHCGVISGSRRQNQIPIIKRNAGVHHFLVHDIHKLAKHDSAICKRRKFGFAHCVSLGLAPPH
jgi:hypothetical protein